MFFETKKLIVWSYLVSAGDHSHFMRIVKHIQSINLQANRCANKHLVTGHGSKHAPNFSIELVRFGSKSYRVTWCINPYSDLLELMILHGSELSLFMI
jgi:hypothetical protein